MNDNYLAIDIGTSSIKAVEKDSSGNSLRWGILERPTRQFHSNIQPLDSGDAAANLRALLEKMGSKADRAVASIPAFLALTALADSPDPSFLPAAPGTFVMSANLIDSRRYFLAGIPKMVAENYADIFQRAGLRLEKIELESAALTRHFADERGAVLIVDVGSRSTTFTVALDGAVKYIEQTDFAAASKSPDVILKKAEKIAADFQTKKNILCGDAVLINLNGFVAPNSSLAVANGLIR